VIAPPQTASVWWRAAGDPVLARFVEQGLAHDPKLNCASVTVRAAAAARSAAAYDYADRRAHKAATVGLAYVEARRWQERLGLQQAALAPLRDNAEIAQFRREAGLVSAIDGEMGGVMAALDQVAVDTARARLTDAVAALARLTDLSPEQVAAWLGDQGQAPDLSLTPPAPAGDAAMPRADLMALEQRLGAALLRHHVKQAAIDKALAQPQAKATPATPLAEAIAAYRHARAQAQTETREAQATIAEAEARNADLANVETLADRAQSDARAGYRAGVETFDKLYVAEAAALSARLARAEARAVAAQGNIDLWTAQGLGWSSADLTLAAAPPAGGSRCE
jgi:outer membrane protein TolC